jgi:sugar lactone lactonase YvrE
VKDSQTTQVTVKYAEQPASNKLWVATGFGSNSSLLAFSSAQLQVPGAPSPAYKISMNSAGFFRGYRGLAFDQMGNLWVADNAKGEILGLSPGQLTGGQVNPAVVIKNNSINSPSGVAFDKKGNLWVSTSTSGDGTLIAYRAETLQRFLAQKGIFSDPPDITIATVKLVNFFTFDANENLWITSDTPPSASLYDDILKFNAQSLNAPGQPSPAIILTGGKQIDFQDTFLDNPAEALAFDKNGNLWGALGNRLFKLAANQLASSGQPKPALWVNLPGSGGSLTKGLVFDALGQIWVTDKDDVSRLIKFVPPNTDNPSIIDGGTVFITSNDIDDPQGLAFYPPPPGYPIY